MTTTPMMVDRGSDAIAIKLANGFDVCFKLDEGCIRGIGAVRYRGRDLRNDDYLIHPSLQSIDGLTYSRFRLVDIESADGVVWVRTEVVPTDSPEVLWQDPFNHECVTMPRPDSALAPVEMVWEIGEYNEEIYGKTVPGFYYSFELKSDADFHSFIEQGTWEIGRLSEPVTVIAQRAGGCPYDCRVGVDDYFHTSESGDTKIVGLNPVIWQREGITADGEVMMWQMMPRGSGSQTFDFQATSDGWIAVYDPTAGYVLALQRTESGMPAIAHLERYYFERRKGVARGKKVVLAHFPEGGVSVEQMRDDWSDVYDTVNDLWRSHYGYVEDEIDTCYSPTMWNAVLDAEPLAYKRVLDMIPKLASYGVKRLYHGIWWKSFFTEKIGSQDICCIIDFVNSEKYGGDELFQEIVDKAHEYGMEVFTWILSAVARRSPMHQGHPDWVCIDRNSFPTATIGHPDLYIMDFNSGWGEYYGDLVIAMKEKFGIDGVFLDSYHNLLYQPINYADPKIRTNVPGLLAWQVRMQKAGLKFMIETNGIYGGSLNWLERGVIKAEGNAGVEHAYYKNMLCVKTPWILNGLIDESLCYRSTANNAPVRTESDFATLDQVELPEQVYEGFLARINRDYRAVRDRMIRRRTLSGDRGVEWMDDKRTQVLALYSFTDSPYVVPQGMRMHDVTEGCEVPTTDGNAQLMKFHTYKMDRA